jgi:hypothetical protein
LTNGNRIPLIPRFCLPVDVSLKLGLSSSLKSIKLEQKEKSEAEQAVVLLK